MLMLALGHTLARSIRLFNLLTNSKYQSCRHRQAMPYRFEVACLLNACDPKPSAGQFERSAGIGCPPAPTVVVQ